jgi:hypothetical protein
MIRLTLAAAAAIAAGSLLAGGATPASAQTAKAPQTQAAAPAAAANTEATGTEEEAEPQVPVLMVTSIEVMRSMHAPTLDIVRVRGIASSDGWSDPELEPITEGTPSDGVLDMVLVARAPSTSSGPTGFVPVEAIFALDTDHPYKGVRVRGASNAILLKALPGYAEGRPVGDDCSKCVGKYFLSAGAAAPAGKQAEDIVRQEDLPPTLRVVKPTDGIASKEHDPNRLTIVIGEDGRIVDAGWD